MIVKGPVLVPDIPDKAGDVLDEETIRKALLIIARNGVLMDVQHSLMNVGKLLELYITDSPTEWMYLLNVFYWIIQNRINCLNI